VDFASNLGLPVAAIIMGMTIITSTAITDTMGTTLITIMATAILVGRTTIRRTRIL
jgi:hypothetical protein